MTTPALLLLGAVLPMAAAGVALRWAAADSRCADARRVAFRLRFPRDLDQVAVASFLRALANLGRRNPWLTPSIVFEVVAVGGGGLEHRLHVPREWVDSLKAQLHVAAPGVALEPLQPASLPVLSAGLELGLTSPWRPLRTDTPATSIAALLTAFLPLGHDEALVMQVVAAPAGVGPTPLRGRVWPAVRPWLTEFLLAFWRPPKRESMSLADQRGKVGEPLVEVTVRLGVHAAGRRRHHLLARLRGALSVLEAPGVWFRPFLSFQSRVVRRLAARRTPRWRTSPVNIAELTGLVAWPIAGPAVPGLALARSRHFPPAVVLPRDGRVLGDGRDEHGSRPVALPLSSAMTHFWALGGTGSGKSTLLASVAEQDLSLPERPAVIVIDPKGDLCADIARRVPPPRQRDVIYLDPASDVLVGLNPLRPDEPDRELVADEVFGVFRQLSSSWGPRLGDLLYTALATLARTPDATLVELPLLLGDDAYRRRILGRLGPDAWTIQSTWSSFESLSPAERAAVAAPILTRVRPWIVRSRLRHLLGITRPKWSFRDVLDHGRILLVTLNPGIIGAETAQLLGSLVLQSLWQAALSRAAVPADQRRPALVYLDEWQQFAHLATVSIGDALALARSYKLGFTLANQTAAQLTPEMLTAVTAHARSKLTFAVEHKDAALLARQFGNGVTPEDLHGLGSYQAIASLMVAGQTAPPVSITTRPPTPPVADLTTIRHLSQERYGFDRDQVEQSIRQRHQPQTPPDGGIGLRRLP